MAQNFYPNMNTMSGHSLVPNPVYPSYATSTMPAEHGNAMDGLMEPLGNLSLTNGGFQNPDKGVDGYSQNSINGAKAPPNSKMDKPFTYQLPDGLLVNTGINAAPATFPRFAPPVNWFGSQYAYPNGSYQPYGGNGFSPPSNPPRNQQWLSSQSLPSVPDLMEPRRTSWSSREDTSPQTPTLIPGGNYQGRTPSNYSGKYSGTPPLMSPQNPNFVCRLSNGGYQEIDFWALINREPMIPEPVPAIHSGPDGGRGTLDKILDNRDGTTNVYVRGLQPNTSDEILEAYGKRFGPVVSCKSIIDANSGHCKGFGFIKYHNFVDAENCIRGFYHRGYEAKFAKKSHNSRLKDLARGDNTNLYVSNLPRLINEEGLKKLFQEIFPEITYPHHQAGSCKILKDSCGVSRGVGFARFETPSICEEIIRSFNNRVIKRDNDSTMLQIRYADTEEQKQLKAFTAVKRQFKADEYNEAVYGQRIGHIADIASYQSPLQRRHQGINGSWISHSSGSSVSPPGFGNYPHSVLRSRQASNLSSGLLPFNGSLEATPLLEEHDSPTIKIESPSVTAATKKAANHPSEDRSTTSNASSKSGEATLVEDLTMSKTLPIYEAVLTPTKAKL